MKYLVASLVGVNTLLVGLVVGIILVQGWTVEWRGFHINKNSATLEQDVQWWPLQIRQEEPVIRGRPLPGFRARGESDQDWQAREMQRRLDKLEEVQRERELREWDEQAMEDLFGDPEIQRLNDRIECLKDAAQPYPLTSREFC